jgi:hypothetical protein
MLALAPKDGAVFTNQTLEAVEWLTNEAWQIPYSSRVDSITNFQYTHASGDDLTVEDLITDAMSLSQEKIASAKEIALDEPQLINKLISPKAHVTGINVIVQLPGERLDQEVSKVVTFVRDLADKVRERYPHLEVHITGIVMMNNSFPEAAKGDMRSLVPIMYLVILIMLGLLLRGFSGTFATLFVISFSIISAMGLAGLLGITIAGPVATAPTMILTLAVADSVHFLVTFRHEMRVNGREKREAIVESLRINFQPIFLTIVNDTIYGTNCF